MNCIQLRTTYEVKEGQGIFQSRKSILIYLESHCAVLLDYHYTTSKVHKLYSSEMTLACWDTGKPTILKSRKRGVVLSMVMQLRLYRSYTYWQDVKELYREWHAGMQGSQNVLSKEEKKNRHKIKNSRYVTCKSVTEKQRKYDLYYLPTLYHILLIGMLARAFSSSRGKVRGTKLCGALAKPLPTEKIGDMHFVACASQAGGLNDTYGCIVMTITTSRWKLNLRMGQRLEAVDDYCLNSEHLC